jgi:hypothetical protein
MIARVWRGVIRAGHVEENNIRNDAKAAHC